MTLPITPNPGTQITEPLITAADYAKLTGDSATSSEDVDEAVADAVITLAEELGRTLPYGQYSETDYLYAQGMVYPSATPIDMTQDIFASNGDNDQSIYNPSTDLHKGGSSIIQGDGIWVGWFTPLPWMPVWTGVIPPQTVITYYGGFYPYGQTGPKGQIGCPRKLASVIARVAYFSLRPVSLRNMPAGVKSMSVGGVSMSGNSLSSFMQADAQLRRDIRRWRHPSIYQWQN